MSSSDLGPMRASRRKYSKPIGGRFSSFRKLKESKKQHQSAGIPLVTEDVEPQSSMATNVGRSAGRKNNKSDTLGVQQYSARSQRESETSQPVSASSSDVPDSFAPQHEGIGHLALFLYQLKQGEMGKARSYASDQLLVNPYDQMPSLLSPNERNMSSPSSGFLSAKRRVTLSCSPATLDRAERVKYTMDLYYVTLEHLLTKLSRVSPLNSSSEAQQLGDSSDIVGKFVYNPLQVVRDREYAARSSNSFAVNSLKGKYTKLVPSASTAFSRRKGRPKCRWEVSVEDMLEDYKWQMRNPQLVYDRNGYPIYHMGSPVDVPGVSGGSSEHSSELSKRYSRPGSIPRRNHHSSGGGSIQSDSPVTSRAHSPGPVGLKAVNYSHLNFGTSGGFGLAKDDKQVNSQSSELAAVHIAPISRPVSTEEDPIDLQPRIGNSVEPSIAGSRLELAESLGETAGLYKHSDAKLVRARSQSVSSLRSDEVLPYSRSSSVAPAERLRSYEDGGVSSSSAGGLDPAFSEVPVIITEDVEDDMARMYTGRSSEAPSEAGKLSVGEPSSSDVSAEADVTAEQEENEEKREQQRRFAELMKARSDDMNKLKRALAVCKMGNLYLRRKPVEASAVMNFSKCESVIADVQRKSMHFNELVEKKIKHDLVEDKLRKVDSIRSELLDSYGIPVDRLLRRTDFMVNEVNTSLRLDARKLEERLNRLSSKDLRLRIRASRKHLARGLSGNDEDKTLLDNLSVEFSAPPAGAFDVFSGILWKEWAYWLVENMIGLFLYSVQYCYLVLSTVVSVMSAVYNLWHQRWFYVLVVGIIFWKIIMA